jgi:hypothetical protein
MDSIYAVASVSNVGSSHGYVGVMSFHANANIPSRLGTPQRSVFDMLTLPTHDQLGPIQSGPQLLEVRVG